MKITSIADLHGNLIDIAPCDVLLICGDISPLEIQRDHIQMTKWITNEFLGWINNLPCDRVILTPGNHDFWFELFCTENFRNLLKNTKLVILMNESYVYRYEENFEPKEIHIYGTPYCESFGPWAFMKEYGRELTKAYADMPNNIDILISHDAPALGGVGIEVHGTDALNFGNIELANAINRVKPRYAICGHIHDGNHSFMDIELPKTFEDEPIKTVKIANCSLLNSNYKLNYEPLTFEYE